MLQLNPAFEPGGYVEDLVGEGMLDQQCARIFRAGKTQESPEGSRLLFHKHQADAIQRRRVGAPLRPDRPARDRARASPTWCLSWTHVLRDGARDGRIKAIVVYPMNALANSQLGELQKFLRHGFAAGQEPVTFRRYTGQESEEERTEILANPPDILLTNYVMLEYLLTRPYDRKLIRSALGLRFLVLDELHTYRGRQGCGCRSACAPRARRMQGRGAASRRNIRDACRPRHIRGATPASRHR